MDANDAMLAIQEIMDGTEWNSDTLGQIAQVMLKAGYRIRDMDDVDLTETPARDTSSVFNINMLDEKHRSELDPARPWVFQGGDAETSAEGFYATEDEACAAQREYRRANGFNEMTGERA